MSKTEQLWRSESWHSNAVKSNAKQILAVACPTCGTRPGEHCELTTGLRRNAPHRDRRWTAEERITPGKQRSCFVSFRHGGAEYSNMTTGFSFFDAAAKALEFFCGPDWDGPRPGRNTLLAVTLLGTAPR